MHQQATATAYPETTRGLIDTQAPQATLQETWFRPAPALPAEHVLVAHFKSALGMRNRNERVALAKLCMLSRNTGYCYMSQAHQAEQLGIGLRTFERWYAGWKRDGRIRVVDRQTVHHTYPQWESLQLQPVSEEVAGPSRQVGGSRLLTNSEHLAADALPENESAALAPAPTPREHGTPATAPSLRRVASRTPDALRAREAVAGTPAALTRRPATALDQPAPALPVVVPPPGLKAALLRKYQDRYAELETVLARPESREDPDATLLALSALRRRDAWNAAGLLRHLIALARRDPALVSVPADDPHGAPLLARLARARDLAEQVADFDRAAAIGEVAFRAGRRLTEQVEALERVQPAALPVDLPRLALVAPQPPPRADITPRAILPSAAGSLRYFENRFPAPPYREPDP